MFISTKSEFTIGLFIYLNQNFFYDEICGRRVIVMVKIIGPPHESLKKWDFFCFYC